MDDAQLIRRYVKEGSQAAFSELVERHLNLVHSAAMRQVGGDFHRARDVSQKVFILLARKAPALTGHTALTGWLHATTHFIAATLMRSERRRMIREEEIQHMNDLPTTPEPPMDWDRLRPVLDGALHDLNERDRDAILWRFFDALPLADIGERLGINASAAQKRVDRALDRMRVSLGRQGTASTTAALALMLTEHAITAAPAGLAQSITAAALAGAGAQTSWLLKFLGKAKLAVGVSGAMWVGGILGVSAIGAASGELWAAWRAHAALLRENEGYAAQQARFRALQQAANRARLAALPAAKSPIGRRNPEADFRKFLATYPGARAAVMEYVRTAAGQAYGAFFKIAGLTPSQIEQFESAVGEAWIQPMAIMPSQLVLGSSPMPPEDRLRAILGEQAYRQLLDYGQTVNAHYWAYTVGLRSPGASFSADQLDQLAQILADRDASPPPRYLIDSPSGLTSIDWDAVLADTKALFSAVQWKAAEPFLLTLEARNFPLKARPSTGPVENPSP